jgi:hypothetical protein
LPIAVRIAVGDEEGGSGADAHRRQRGDQRVDVGAGDEQPVHHAEQRSGQDAHGDADHDGGPRVRVPAPLPELADDRGTEDGAEHQVRSERQVEDARTQEHRQPQCEEQRLGHAEEQVLGVGDAEEHVVRRGHREDGEQHDIEDQHPRGACPQQAVGERRRVQGAIVDGKSATRTDGGVDRRHDPTAAL